MIPRECKRLAEVDFPIAEVSRHAVREKSIRHGHPSTLHLWWARRPLASSRAILLALLLPDPADPHCPEQFRSTASQLIGDFAKFLTKEKPGVELLLADLKSALRSTDSKKKEAAKTESRRRQEMWRHISDTKDWDPLWVREALLRLLAQGSAWEWSSALPFLQLIRNLVRVAHGDEAPLVVDPFAGGGSIPLEALRLGCDAFASDLNPVACLILKTMLDDIPRHGQQLADELRWAGGEIKATSRQKLTDLYPNDSDGVTPIAYIWARTVRCEAPNCGAEIPLMRSFWLCKKPKRKWALKHRVERSGGAIPQVVFKIFQPRADNEVRGGTVNRAKATCLSCGSVLPAGRVRSQLVAQRGGADVVFDERGKRAGGARMTAVVTLQPGQSGRNYRLPTDADYVAVRSAQMRVATILDEWERGGREGLCPVPDEPTPTGGGSGAGRAFSVQRYGMAQWGDLFTARQKVVLVELGRLVQESAKPLRTVLAVALSRTADGSASVSSWLASGEEVKHVFARPALPIVWDFGESNYLADASRSWTSAISSIAKVIECSSHTTVSAQVQQADAIAHPLPDQSARIWFTDPPYYDAIPYSDLSDFFLVWLKRTLPDHPLMHDPFDPGNLLSPKTREAVQDETRQQDGCFKDRAWFEGTMAKAFADGRRVLDESGVGSVVFAHKTTEGWEALLSGLIRGGWTITGSWPIATEMTSRLRAHESAALATSIHLICRPRPDDAPVGDWAGVLRESPVRIGNWMKRMQGEDVRGADLVFACIGPALQVFSRYRTVETAEGHEVGLPKYLERIWEDVSRLALQQVLGQAEGQAHDGMAGTLEEDARLTALFLWTLQTTGPSEENETDENDEDTTTKATAAGFTLPFDVVRRFAQPMGIDLDLWTGRVISQNKGVVRLRPVTERAGDLFGHDGTEASADWIERRQGDGVQALPLFPELDVVSAPHLFSAAKRTLDGDRELHNINTTTLDHVHAAMLLQASGHARALRALIAAEQDRGSDFLRLANALSALYPRGSQEKRLLDAMLLVVPK